MTQFGIDIDKITALFNANYKTTTSTTHQNFINCVWGEPNNATEGENSTKTGKNADSDEVSNAAKEQGLSEDALAKIKAYVEAREAEKAKRIAEGDKKYAEIEKARKEVTGTGLSYDDALKILEDLPRAGFGVINDDKTGQLRFPTVDEIYDFCKRNPDNKQAQKVVEQVDLARQTIKEFEAKYPEVTSKDYMRYSAAKTGAILLDDFGV